MLNFSDGRPGVTECLALGAPRRECCVSGRRPRPLAVSCVDRGILTPSRSPSIQRSSLDCQWLAQVSGWPKMPCLDQPGRWWGRQQHFLPYSPRSVHDQSTCALLAVLACGCLPSQAGLSCDILWCRRPLLALTARAATISSIGSPDKTTVSLEVSPQACVAAF